MRPSIPSQDPPPVAEKAALRPSRWGLDDGDVRLVLWMLSLTPLERLRFAEDFQRGIMTLRDARRV